MSIVEMLRAQEELRLAERVLVLVGAGLSAESGIPTFRGPDGMWKQFRPEDLANPDGFRRHPETVWEWYRWRLKKVQESDPNDGHRALAELALHKPLQILNQNVDGLLEQAFKDIGSDSRCIQQLHGSIQHAHCSSCGYECAMSQVGTEAVPACTLCSAAMRPSIVWFGEALSQASLEALLKGPDDCTLMLSVGTSAQVWPAASVLPAMQMQGKTIIEINTMADAFASSGSLRLEGSSSAMLTQLIRGLNA